MQYFSDDALRFKSLAASSWSHYDNGASLPREAPFFVIRAIDIADFRHCAALASFACYPPREFFIRSFYCSRHFRALAALNPLVNRPERARRLASRLLDFN
jgi:hypothetical protein